jgi:hypothetical protein
LSQRDEAYRKKQDSPDKKTVCAVLQADRSVPGDEIIGDERKIAKSTTAILPTNPAN